MSTLVDLVDMIEKPEGVHNINIKLFSISSPKLRFLQELALEFLTNPLMGLEEQSHHPGHCQLQVY